MNQLVWIIILWGIKGDFMCKYFDLRLGLPKALQRVVMVTCVLTVVSFLISLNINLFYCLPLNRLWELSFDRCSPQSSRVPMQIIISLHLANEIAGKCVFSLVRSDVVQIWLTMPQCS